MESSNINNYSTKKVSIKLLNSGGLTDREWNEEALINDRVGGLVVEVLHVEARRLRPHGGIAVNSVQVRENERARWNPACPRVRALLPSRPML